MKNIVSRSLITILSITLVSSAYSQEVAVNKKNVEPPFPVTEIKEPSVDIPYINNVNGKVLKSFHRSFGERPDAIWSKTENGFAVYFKDSNTSTNVYYRNTGAVDCRINYYSGDQLPKAIRHTVKSNFYDYAIKQVSEVQKDGSVFYFVKVEDKDSIKTVRVVEEEWQVVEEITKQVQVVKAKNDF